MRATILALLASIAASGTASAAVPKGARAKITASAHKDSTFKSEQIVNRRVSVKETKPKVYEARINGTVKSTGARMTFKRAQFAGTVKKLQQTRRWEEDFNY